MTRDTYYELGGHKRDLRLLEEITAEREIQPWKDKPEK